MMKFSLMTYSLVPLMRTGEMKLEDVIRFAAEEGFAAVELLLLDFSRPAKDITDLLDKYGVGLSCVDAFLDLAAEDEAAHAQNVASGKALIDKAAELGSPLVMLVPAFADNFQGEADKERALPRIIRGLQELVPYAQSKNLALTIENFPDLRVPFCSQQEIESILAEVPGLKLTLDGGNLLVAGDDTLAAYNKLHDRIVNIHVKDWKRSLDGTGTRCADGTYLKPGEHADGIVDHRALFRSLLDNNYSGYLAFEYEGEKNCKDATREGLQHLKAELDELLAARK